MKHIFAFQNATYILCDLDVVIVFQLMMRYVDKLNISTLCGPIYALTKMLDKRGPVTIAAGSTATNWGPTPSL